MGLLLPRAPIRRVPVHGRMLPGVATRPLSGEDTFSPLDLSWYRLWIPSLGTQWQDTARTTPAVADSDPVGSGQSLFGSAKYAEQATAGKRPLLRTEANGINGKSCWSVDTTDDWLAELFGETISQPTTIYVVCSFGSIADYRTAYDGGQGESARQSVYTNTATGVLIQYAGGEALAAVAASGVQIVTAVFSGTASKLRRNGVEILAGNPGTGGLTGLTIGASVSGADALGGKIGFLGIRQGADDVGTQQKIEQWANTYFALGF